MVRSQKGFTIIELVVVIVILGILAAVAFPKFSDLSGDAHQAVVNGTGAAVKSAAVILFAKNGGSKNSPTAIRGAVDFDPLVTTISVASCDMTVQSVKDTLRSVIVNVSGDYCI